MSIKHIVPALLLATGISFAAQAATPQASKPATQPTAEQQAQARKLQQQMVQAATGIAQLIDAGKAGEVWDGASSIAKKAVDRDTFVKQTVKDRTALGPMTSRKVGSVNLSQSDGSDKNVPAGVYANVAFSTSFSKSKQPVRELVSFHLDKDNTWRLSGYTVH